MSTFFNKFFSGLTTGRPDFSDNPELVEKLAGSLAGYIHKNPESGQEVLFGLLKGIGDLQRENEALKTASATDALTGALNRRGFDQLVSEIDSSKLHHARQPTGRHFLAVIDMDGFKGINDTLGHDAGDEALKHTVKELKTLVRDSDIVARTGGDEFIVILKSATPEGAEEKFKQIRETFNALSFKYQDVNVPVRATIAHGEIDPNRLTRDIIREIDGKMYALKREKTNPPSRSNIPEELCSDRVTA